MNAANAEPEWLMNVIPPGRRSGGSSHPVARKPSSTFTNPMQLPPQIAMPASRAIAARRSTSGGASERGSSNPLA
jgi:hypothetical protein